MRFYSILSVAFFAMLMLFGFSMASLNADAVKKNPDQITLTSPDGKSSIVLQATNDGPAIWMWNGKTGEDISIVALSNAGTYIGVRKDRSVSDPACNLALAIDKNGSPYIQFHDAAATKMLDMRKIK